MGKSLQGLNLSFADKNISVLSFTLACKIMEISHCSHRVVGNLFFEQKKKSLPFLFIAEMKGSVSTQEKKVEVKYEG